MASINPTQTVAANAQEYSLEEKRNSAIKGAFFFEYVDMSICRLSPYRRSRFISSRLTFRRGSNHFASVVFITALLDHPLCALLFGMVADKLGRHKAPILLGLGIRRRDIFDRAAAGIRNAGAWFLFVIGVAKRFIDGILGGGYTGAMLLAIEYAPKEKRGFVGGFIIADFPAAYISINLIAMLMFVFSLDGLNSLYGSGISGSSTLSVRCLLGC